MLIYSTPGTGKTTLCLSDRNYQDGDDLLVECIRSASTVNIDTIMSFHTKSPNYDNSKELGKFVLQCYNDGCGDEIEKAYSLYRLELLRFNGTHTRICLFGTRRFMWMAKTIFTEHDFNTLSQRKDPDNAQCIIAKEIESIKRWNLKTISLNGKFISEALCINV